MIGHRPPRVQQRQPSRLKPWPIAGVTVSSHKYRGLQAGVFRNIVCCCLLAEAVAHGARQEPESTVTWPACPVDHVLNTSPLLAALTFPRRVAWLYRSVLHKLSTTTAAQEAATKAGAKQKNVVKMKKKKTPSQRVDAAIATAAHNVARHTARGIVLALLCPLGGVNAVSTMAELDAARLRLQEQGNVFSVADPAPPRTQVQPDTFKMPVAMAAQVIINRGPSRSRYNLRHLQSGWLAANADADFWGLPRASQPPERGARHADVNAAGRAASQQPDERLAATTQRAEPMPIGGSTGRAGRSVGEAAIPSHDGGRTDSELHGSGVELSGGGTHGSSFPLVDDAPLLVGDGDGWFHDAPSQQAGPTAPGHLDHGPGSHTAMAAATAATEAVRRVTVHGSRAAPVSPASQSARTHTSSQPASRNVPIDAGTDDDESNHSDDASMIDAGDFNSQQASDIEIGSHFGDADSDEQSDGATASSSDSSDGKGGPRCDVQAVRVAGTLSSPSVLPSRLTQSPCQSG